MTSVPASHPPEPMDTTPRDPHLPPPAVVDWLLEQNWSEMIPVTNIQYGGAKPHGMTKSKHWKYQMACSEFGEDCGGRILLPVEAIAVLRKDQENRRDAFEQKRRACEADELAKKAEREQERIFKLDEKARAGPWASR